MSSRPKVISGAIVFFNRKQLALGSDRRENYFGDQHWSMNPLLAYEVEGIQGDIGSWYIEWNPGIATALFATGEINCKSLKQDK